jgi:hypothetical protein
MACGCKLIYVFICGCYFYFGYCYDYLILVTNLLQRAFIDTTRYNWNVTQLVVMSRFATMSLVVINVIATEEWSLQLRLVQL